MTCIDGSKAHWWLVPSPSPDIGPFAEARCKLCGAVKDQAIWESVVKYGAQTLAPAGEHAVVTAKRTRRR